LSLIGCVSTGASRRDDITGSARNESRSQLAAGDEVILLRLDGGRQEETRAKTSARGAFAFHVHYPGKPYLVRVIHQGLAYEQRAVGGDALSIPVFDAARQIAGVTGSIEILRAEAQGNLLHVSDMYEISNQSRPPLTLARGRTFEVYLPATAQIHFVWAAGPENVRLMISAVPISGEPGHYAVSFPLRPGATKFGFEYDLLYRGDVTFQTRHVYPLQQFAVMIPRTMRFSSRFRPFLLLNTGNPPYQVRAANHLKAGEGPSFELSGSGQLPPLLYEAKSLPVAGLPSLPKPTASAAARVAPPFSPDIGSGPAQIQPPSQAAALHGVILILLATCAVLVWRARRKERASTGHLANRHAGKTARSRRLRRTG
jgi:hypothetical protein